MKKQLYGLIVAGVIALATASPVSAFIVCDAVGATDNLNVRSSPSLSGTWLATMPTGSIGNILTGPASADGSTWWYLKWTSGQTGWSVENYMQFVFPDKLAYADSYGIGWCLYPWNNTTVTEQSTTVRVGSSALATTTSAAWARLYLRTNAISTVGYSSLRFSIRGTSSNGQILYVALYNTAGAPIQYLDLFDYVSGGSLTPNVWNDVRIPLADLNASGVFIGGIVIESAQPTTFYVDDVALDVQSGTTFWNPPPPSGTQANNLVYSDALQTGWTGGSWSNTVSDFASSGAHGGQKGITVTTSAQYGRLKIVTPSGYKFNTTNYQSISFWINIGVYETESLYIGLLDASGNVIHYEPLDQFAHEGELLAYQWEQLEVPLVDLSGANRDIHGIEIQFTNPGSISLDAIRFDPTGGACYAE